MLLDHIGYTLKITYPYRIIGRIAFPIYAFLLTEDITTLKTSKISKEAFLFALVSEIPFNLFSKGKLIDISSSKTSSLPCHYPCFFFTGLTSPRKYTKTNLD